MENLTYITSNYGKYIATKEKFERAGITIDYFKFEFEEPNINDLELISKEKAKQAYQKVGNVYINKLRKIFIKADCELRRFILDKV